MSFKCKSTQPYFKCTPLAPHSVCGMEKRDGEPSALFTIALNLAGLGSPQRRAVFRNAAFAFEPSMRKVNFSQWS